MTLWSSPHPKCGATQNSVDVGTIKELTPEFRNPLMPSSSSFASDSSEDAGFEEGSLDVDMGEEETEEIQIDCIQTLEELDPMANVHGTVSMCPDSKTPIPLPPPPMQVGSAYGGNQAYANNQNILPRIMDRPSSPLRAIWGSSSANDSHRTRGDVGLNNIGNTCFMNSGLQCLVHTSPLVEFFLGRDTYEKLSTPLVYQFNSLMNHIWFGSNGAISLHDFKTALGNKYGQFKDCRQHDCQEFLAVLLDFLHEELKSTRKSVLSMADSSVSRSYIEDCTPLEEAQTTSSTEVINRLDVGCGDTVDGIPGTKRLKLEGDLQAVVKSDDLDGDEEVKRKTTKPTDTGSSNESDILPPKEQSSNEVSTGNLEQPSFKNTADSPIHKAQKYWDSYMKENDTVIASTFQGMFKSCVTCSECNFVSETFEPFWYLSLPIPRVMEKQIAVTFISMMKERNPVKVDVTMHLIGTTGAMIQEVLKTIENGGGPYTQTKYVAAEVYNNRVSRILEDKVQLRNVGTSTCNIYVYELNENFEENDNGDDVADNPPTLKKENEYQLITSNTREPTNITAGQFSCQQSVEPSTAEASTSTACLPAYGPMGAPVGGGFYDAAASNEAIQQMTNSTDDPLLPQNDNFNKIQCNICLEDYTRSEVRKHRTCSCVLCEECIKKSVEHFKSEGTQAQEYLIKCAVCLQEVDSKKTFISLEDPSVGLSSPDLILMSILFRHEPGTDANNNASWHSGLFGHPWLIRVPSYVNATELLEYIESINPAPEVDHRIVSVKSDGLSCGQCVFSSRCSGCEIPKEGMISLNSHNSILISYVDMSIDTMEPLKASDMMVHDDFASAWPYNRNEEPTIDIHDCLRTFSETEHLDEQNPWFCPRCDKNQRATKAFSICKFPDYLIVYLKRFVFLDQASNKLNNRLTFPINDLDVSEYVTEGFGGDVGKYNLYSCVCHFGSASAGHYTAYAKNPETKLWHYFNDETIQERSPADAEYSSAYVLFYEKQGLSCNIPNKCIRPLPELNSFNTTSSFTTDTRGSYLPGEPSASIGPGRNDGDFMDANLQVDSSTSPNFSYPHPSTESDLLDLEVDEGVGNETDNRVTDIRDGLGFSEADGVTSTSEATEKVVIRNEDVVDSSNKEDNTVSTSSQISSTGGGDADSTSN